MSPPMTGADRPSVKASAMVAGGIGLPLLAPFGYQMTRDSRSAIESGSGPRSGADTQTARGRAAKSVR